MKAVKFDYNMSKVLLRKLHLGSKLILVQYKDCWSEPEIKYPNQVIAQTIYGGICTSDLHQIFLESSYYISIMATKARYLTLGHELVAKITKTGESVVGLEEGDRVTYNPIPHCETMGFKPCPSCQRGNYEHCYCLVGQGDGSDLEKQYNDAGGFGGFLAGGFGERFWGFGKQFHKVPENVPSEVAVMSEPFAVAIHAVARNPPKESDLVIVVGMGIIGLLTIAALRAFGHANRIIALARYPFQAAWAKKLGADEVITERKPAVLYQKITDMTGARIFQPVLSKKVVFGNLGADIIYDCVNTEASLDDDIRLIQSSGKIVQVGLGYVYTKKVDWSIPIYKELDVVGSMMYGMQVIDGERVDPFELALKFFSKDPEQYNGLMTHTFPIEEYKQAFECAEHKGKHEAIKVGFKYGEQG